jgi:hypothetical protein
MQQNWYENFPTFLTEAKASPDFSMEKEQLLAYPIMLNSVKARLAVAFVADVVTPTGRHTVAVHYGHKPDRSDEREFSVWCGDKFLEGRLSLSEAQDRVHEALSGVSVSQLWNHPPRDLAVYDKAARSPLTAGQASLVAPIMANFDAYPASGSNCDFWFHFRQPKRKVCEHASHVLAMLRDTRPDFQEVMRHRHDELMSIIKQA